MQTFLVTTEEDIIANCQYKINGPNKDSVRQTILWGLAEPFSKITYRNESWGSRCRIISIEEVEKDESAPSVEELLIGNGNGGK